MKTCIGTGGRRGVCSSGIGGEPCKWHHACFVQFYQVRLPPPHPQSPPLDTYLMITNEPAYHHQKTMGEDVHPDVEITACPMCVPVTFKAQKGVSTKKRKKGDQQD